MATANPSKHTSSKSSRKRSAHKVHTLPLATMAALLTAATCLGSQPAMAIPTTTITTPTYNTTARSLTKAADPESQNREADVVVNNQEWLETPSILEFQRYRATNDENKDKRTMNSDEHGSDEYNTLIKKTDMYAHIETIDGAKYLVFDVFFNNDAQSMVNLSNRQWYIWQVPYQIAKLNSDGSFANDTIRDLRFDAYRLKDKSKNDKIQRRMNLTLSRDFSNFEKVDNQSTTINFPNDSEKNFGVGKPSRFQYSLGPNLTSDSQYEANMKSLFHENYQDYAIGKATYPDYPYSSKNYGIGIQTTEVNLAFHMHAAVKLNSTAINEKATTYDEKYANIHNAWTWADSATYGRTTSSSYAWVSGRDPQSENDQKLHRHKDDSKAPKIYYNGKEITDGQTINLHINDKLSFTTSDNKGYIEKFSISGLTDAPITKQGAGSESKPLPSGDITVTKKMKDKEVTITSEDGSGNVTTRKVKVTVTKKQKLSKEHPITGKTINTTVGEKLPELTDIDKFVDITDGDNLEKKPTLMWNGKSPAPNTETVGEFTHSIKGTYSDGSTKTTDVTIKVKPQKPVIDTDLTNLAGRKEQKVTVSVGSGIPEGTTTTVKLFDKDNNEIGSTTTINGDKAEITVKNGIPEGDVYATTNVTRKPGMKPGGKIPIPGFDLTSENSDKKQATKPQDTQAPTITATSSPVTVGQDLKIHIVAKDDVKVEEVPNANALMQGLGLELNELSSRIKSSQTTNTDKEKDFDLTVKNMQPKEVGTHTITFTVKDSAGNTGTTTLTITVKPAVSDQKAENKTGKDKTTVSGKTTPGATVTISKNGKEVGKVTAGDDGSFTVDIDKQDPNTKLTLTPSKNGVTGDPVETTVTGENPAAEKPAVSGQKAENKTGKDKTTVSGKTTPGATVTISKNGKEVGKVTAGDDGSFTVDIDKQDPNTKLTLTPSKNGVTGDPVETTVTGENPAAEKPAVSGQKAENKTGKDKTTVSGKTTPGATVTISKNGKEVGKVTAGDDGSFTVDIDKQDPNTKLTLTPSKNGVTGDPVETTVTGENPAAEKPAVSGQKAENKTGKDKTTVSGKTTPGATVTISKNGKEVGKVTAGDDGSFTVDIDKQDPNTKLTLTPSKNGVTGDPVETTVTGENPAAEKPAVSGQKAENKTGKDKTTVSGKTTPGATVTISKNGKEVGKVTAGDDGSFTVDIDKQDPNTKLTLTPSKNGVTGDPVETTVTGENPAAEKPAVSGQKAENKTGKDKTTVSGKTTPGATVTISKNGKEVGKVTAGDDGSFTVDIDKQDPNTKLTLTPSKNGVTGDPVETTVTGENPAAEKPAVSGQKAENKTGKDKTTVSGKTTPGATVTISKNGKEVGKVTAGDDGSFTVDIDKQDPNTKLTLTPSKNGVTGDPVETTVTGENPAAEKPAVSGQKAENKTGKDKTTVSGKTTPGATVTISKNGKEVGKVTAGDDGSFTVDIDKQDPNTKLTLTPSKNGVTGDPVETTVTGENPAAEKPAVSGQKAENKTGKDKTTVSGKTTPGATVTISKNGKEVGKVTAGDDGSFTVDIDKQDPNTKLTLTPSKNGVTGDPVETTVTGENPAAEKPAVSGQKAENKTGKDKTTVSGKTTPGATVTISKNGKEVGKVTAGDDGSFTVDIDKQDPNTKLTLTPSKNGVTGDPVETTVTGENPAAEKPAVSGQKAENKTGKDKTTVSGKTTPGATVTISKNGKEVGKVTAGDDGSFTVDIDKQDPNTKLTLTPSKNGVTGDPVETTVTGENPAAEKPAVSGQKAENKTGKDKTTVSGKTTPGATVTISKNGKEVGKVTAGDDGSFTVDIDKQDPNTKLTLTPSKNGVTGDPVETTVTGENPAAEKPAVSGQKAENKTGKDKTTVSGKTTPGATVTISKNGKEVGKVTAGDDGSFTVDIDKQDPNTKLTLTPSKNGVTGDPVETTVTGENPAAEKPAVSGQKAENKTGKDKTTVSGKTTPGATVTISKNGKEVGKVTAGDDGSFTVDIDKQDPNTKLTLTPSKNGVTGDPVETTVTGENPAAEKPAVSGQKAENKTGKDKTTVSGKTTPGATVTISKNGKEVGKVTAGDDGSFTVDIDKQDPNTKLTLTPSKNGVTGDPVETTVTGENPAAEKPAVSGQKAENKTGKDKTTVSGKTTPGATVTISKNGKEVGKVTAGDDGSFTVDIDKQDPNTKLTLTPSKNGVTGDPVETTVTGENPAAEKPAVSGQKAENKTGKDKTTVSGKTTPGATVTISKNGKEVGKVTAGDDGSFTVDIDKQDPNTKLTLTPSKNGVTGDPVETTVTGENPAAEKPAVSGQKAENKTGKDKTTVSGKTTPGATVTISKNGKEVGKVTAGDDGSFTVDIDKQDPNTKLTLTPSKNGVTGDPVETTVTGENPAAEKPAVSGQKAENKTGKDKTTVSGKTTPGATVTISKNGKEVGKVTAGDDGSFTVDIDKQDPNTKLTLTPSKNGVTGDPVETTVTGENPAAEKPAVSGQKAENKTGKDKTTVSGKTTPGATVTISKNGKEVGKVTAGDDGSFTVDIDKQDPNTKLTLTPSKNGVTGDPVETTVTGENPAAEKPAAPKVEPQNDGSVDVTPAAGTDTLEITYTPEGETNPKTITVKKGNDGKWKGENTPEGVTVDEGTGKVTIPANKVKDGSSVTAKDKKGNNTSDEATGKAGNNGGNSGSGTGSGSDSGNDSTSNNGGSASGSTTGGSSSTDSGAQNSTNESSSADNANNAGNAETGNAGNASTGASGSNASTKSGNKVPAKHSSQLVKTGAEVERVGLISAMIGVLGAAAAFFSRKKNRE
ncbi:Ig-like domain-containing protein [Gardnerella swidsinskii]|uniref:Ig-like domain-containing protein n=1 Tax=Gardnerella swidsinskii TaxID=2792979 RepID=UPI0036F49F2C